ncbi:50S ribosomal protein L13 [Candidatus Peregrinibacteria bacterium]|nr:50S ribosomal protein L13 [Candidatus Peregrinibacteria bacterium]
MKTFSPKKTDVNRKWYLVDAKEKPAGRLAAKIAHILRGKHKTIFAPHIDCGDYVIVINAKKIKLTGTKPEKKMYFTHSGYLGSIKETPAGKIMKEKPEMFLKNMVAGMIPHNRLKRDVLSKLKIFAGNEHNISVQSIETLE